MPLKLYDFITKLYNDVILLDGKATVVGVVSRGGDCAAFNSPGIYTNVQKHLKWINKRIKKWNC